ncbi:MAG TPA: TorF family putative porin [Gammaproteobacteria bacterium]|nr:TorF family putative porin [Gammaproteobacteria bacterium]
MIANKRLVGLALAGTLACAGAQAAGVGGSVTLTNNYMFRGISQTDNSAAVQGGFEGELFGVYGGLWASNVQFNAANNGDGSMELDIYAGYKGSIGKHAGYDVGSIWYEYPNSSSGLSYSYNEVYAGGHYRWFSLKDYYSWDFFGGSGKANYLDLGFTYTLPMDVDLGLHVGRQTVEDNANFGYPDYTDYSIGVSKQMGGFGLGLKYTDTNLSQADCGNTKLCDGQAVVSLSKSF